MRRLAAAVLLVLLSVSSVGAQRFPQATSHISTQTTTTVLTNSSTTKRLSIMAGSLCVDMGGATTSVTLQDSGGTNLFGSGVVWVIAAGSCLNFPYRGFYYGIRTGVGLNLQVVTGTGNGPVEVYLEVDQS